MSLLHEQQAQALEIHAIEILRARLSQFTTDHAAPSVIAQSLTDLMFSPSTGLQTVSGLRMARAICLLVDSLCHAATCKADRSS